MCFTNTRNITHETICPQAATCTPSRSRPYETRTSNTRGDLDHTWADSRSAYVKGKRRRKKKVFLHTQPARLRRYVFCRLTEGILYTHATLSGKQHPGTERDGGTTCVLPKKPITPAQMKQPLSSPLPFPVLSYSCPGTVPVGPFAAYNAWITKVRPPIPPSLHTRYMKARFLGTCVKHQKQREEKENDRRNHHHITATVPSVVHQGSWKRKVNNRRCRAVPSRRARIYTVDMHAADACQHSTKQHAVP